MVVTVELTVVGVVQVLAWVVEELGTEDSQTYFLAPLQPTSSQVPELMPSILTQSWLAAVAGLGWLVSQLVHVPRAVPSLHT